MHDIGVLAIICVFFFYVKVPCINQSKDIHHRNKFLPFIRLDETLFLTTYFRGIGGRYLFCFQFPLVHPAWPTLRIDPLSQCACRWKWNQMLHGDRWPVMCWNARLIKTKMMIMITMMIPLLLHPGRLTWNLRIHPWKRNIIFQNHHFQVLC